MGMASTPTPTLTDPAPERRLVNVALVDRLWISHDATRHEVRQRGATGDLASALRMLRAADLTVQGVLITDVLTGECWYTRRDVIAAHDLRVQLDFRHRMDEWHRAEGHELCWCSRWVHPDDLYEGTCGAAECLRAEGQDRAGLVP